MNLKSELELLLDLANKLSKNLKIKRQEAIMLIVAQHAAAMHYHLDCVLQGITRAHPGERGATP